MNIHDFANALEKRLKEEVPSAQLKREAEFERNHVIDPAWELSQAHPEICVSVHPAKKREMCGAGCGGADPSSRVKGCPRCWKESKGWSAVNAFGTRNNFDLVAKDREGKILAVEVKWLAFSSGKGPNGEFQRFIGQCALAAAIHDEVIGVCGFRGQPRKKFDEQEDAVRKTMRGIGVRLVLVQAKLNSKK